MNYSRGISFAKNGNITAKSDVGSYSYEGNNHQVTKAGSFGFTYDANGNMITKLSNSALVEYKYDARNVLSQVTNAYVGDDGGRWAKFSYDASGQRFRKYSSLGNDVLYPNGYYAIKNSKWTNNHIYAGKERICTLVNGEPSFIHRDQINSGGLVTTNAGLVGDKVAFAPYGEILYQANTNSTLEEKFTGQILDEETGLYYYNARYYDPKIGIFISADTIVPDPYDSQSMNRYMYVRGNPVKYIDPTGHSFVSFIEDISDAVTDFLNEHHISVDIQGSYSTQFDTGLGGSGSGGGSSSGSQGGDYGGGAGPTVDSPAVDTTSGDVEMYSSGSSEKKKKNGPYTTTFYGYVEGKGYVTTRVGGDFYKFDGLLNKKFVGKDGLALHKSKYALRFFGLRGNQKKYTSNMGLGLDNLDDVKFIEKVGGIFSTFNLKKNIYGREDNSFSFISNFVRFDVVRTFKNGKLIGTRIYLDGRKF